MQELPNDIEGLWIPPGIPWHLLLLILLIAAALAIVIYFWRRRRRKGVAGLVPVTRALTKREQMEATLKELRLLRTNIVDVNCHMLAAALDLSVIIKRLIEWNGLRQALYFTMEELDLKWRVAPPLSAQDKIFVVSLLSGLDRIKFAGQASDPQHIAVQLETLEALLKRLYDLDVKREGVLHA